MKKTIRPRVSVKELEDEVKFMKSRGVPRCLVCHTDYIKVEEESGEYHSTWKPNCKCLKKDIRISLG